MAIPVPGMLVNVGCSCLWIQLEGLGGKGCCELQQGLLSEDTASDFNLWPLLNLGWGKSSADGFKSWAGHCQGSQKPESHGEESPSGTRRRDSIPLNSGQWICMYVWMYGVRWLAWVEGNQGIPCIDRWSCIRLGFDLSWCCHLTTKNYTQPNKTNVESNCIV